MDHQDPDRFFPLSHRGIPLPATSHCELTPMSSGATLVSDPAAPPLSRRERRTSAERQRSRFSDTWVFTVLVAIVYLALSVLVNYQAWAHGITHTVQTAGGSDVPEEIWFLAQTPWSVIHGHSLFANTYLNAP